MPASDALSDAFLVSGIRVETTFIWTLNRFWIFRYKSN